MDLENILNRLKADGNLRSIPEESEKTFIDFTSNDYLGIASDIALNKQFLLKELALQDSLSSSASRLLSQHQNVYTELEEKLSSIYYDGAASLLFNSGYHANTGILSALGQNKQTVFIADKLVHASIIDGILLSRCEYRRFRHNDMNHLEHIIRQVYDLYEDIVVIVESIYSMEGDSAPLDALILLKNKFPRIILYVDEAHAFGVKGSKGAGLCMRTSSPEAFNVIVGTFGKAAASSGAFAVTSALLRKYLINKCRSLIFSTAISPLQTRWTSFVVDKIIDMDDERLQLEHLSRSLRAIMQKYSHSTVSPSHIQPLIIGDPIKTTEISDFLKSRCIKALPIRRPTVPPGTERLRLSLSASMDPQSISLLDETLNEICDRLI